jgi:hypothetical protein
VIVCALTLEQLHLFDNQQKKVYKKLVLMMIDTVRLIFVCDFLLLSHLKDLRGNLAYKYFKKTVISLSN